MSPKTPPGEKTVVSNRRAYHDFEILEKYEAGLKLTGAEVKSLRGGRGSLSEAYARVHGDEVWIEGMHIPPYEQAMDKHRYDPTRTRKLLLHRDEIRKMVGKVAEKGLTLVPLELYFKGGRVKVLLGLARGKQAHDKRETIKRREADRETRAAVKERRGR